MIWSTIRTKKVTKEDNFIVDREITKHFILGVKVRDITDTQSNETVDNSDNDRSSRIKGFTQG